MARPSRPHAIEAGLRALRERVDKQAQAAGIDAAGAAQVAGGEQVRSAAEFALTALIYFCGLVLLCCLALIVWRAL